LAQAIAELPSLGTLRMRVANSTVTTACTILSRLHDAGHSLSELDLRMAYITGSTSWARNSATQMQALKCVLQSTASLKSLTLGMYCFNKVGMKCLIAGLTTNTTLTKLALV
jgi:hypothetical protein